MSMEIDISKCNGCGACVNACPRQAIAIRGALAVIDENLCVQCGICADVCPAGAIRETAPARAELAKGGERMMYGYGGGFGYGRGGGYGRGFGFRGSSPPWPYVGRGRGGLPRCFHPGLWGGAVPYAAPGAPYGATPTRDEELDFLKEQSSVMRREMEGIERRIQELEKKE